MKKSFTCTLLILLSIVLQAQTPRSTIRPVDSANVQPMDSTFFSRLDSVVVRAGRRGTQQRIDGTVINPDASVMSRGSSVLEVLERSPGVSIDRQNSAITLNGKSGVSVMLNGKPVRMSVDQLTVMLSGMNAGEVARIELLTNPSSAYDAEGSAGVINIITRKNNQQGTNGTVTLSAGYGYREKGLASVSLNHNDGPTALYGNYSFSRDRGYTDFHGVGSEQEPLLGGLAQSDYISKTMPGQNNHHLLLGVDQKINARNTIGASLDYTNSRISSKTVNHGRYLVNDSAYDLNATVNGLNQWNILGTNLYYDHRVSERTKWSINADMIRYKNDYPLDAFSSFIDPHGQQVSTNDTLFAPTQKSNSHTLIQLGSVKMDVEKKLNTAVSLQAGVKGTYTGTTSRSGVSSLLNGVYVNRPSAVSNMQMNEGIAAAYTSVKAALDPLTELTAGVRYEYSDTKMTDEYSKVTITERKLGRFFPNILLSRKWPAGGEGYISFSQRISRAAYSDLASYVTYNGPNSVNTGNPLLKPTLTTNFKIGYSKSGYALSLLLSRDLDPIARKQVVYTADHLQLAVAPQNLIVQDNISLQFNLPVTISSWWSMNNTFTGGWRQFKLDYTLQPAQKSYWVYGVNTAQTFRLGDYSLELSGFYNAPYYNGSRKTDRSRVLNGGIKKEFKNRKGSVQFTVTDMFQSNVVSSYFGALTHEAFDLHTHVLFHNESSKYLIFRLSVTKTFGSSNAVRKNEKEQTEESERMRN